MKHDHRSRLLGRTRCRRSRCPASPGSVAQRWRNLRYASARGDLRADSDTDALLSLLLMIFPHLALAPFVRGLDPILGLDDPTPEQPALAVRRLVAVLAAAFAAQPSTIPARS